MASGLHMHEVTSVKFERHHKPDTLTPVTKHGRGWYVATLACGCTYTSDKLPKLGEYVYCSAHI